MSYSAGIDFGTSNSTVGLPTNNGPQLVKLEGEAVTLPSAIFFMPTDTGNKLVYGREAISAYTGGEEGRFMRALKSLLGTSQMDMRAPLRTDVRDHLNELNWLKFKHMVGYFIGNLKQITEQSLGNELSGIVLGRPVFFVDGDSDADSLAQKQLEDAARSQGFTHVEFQYEPVAAALDYEQNVAKEELALIADIGGGTSDFSLVRVSPERRSMPDRRADILANSGVHVGGTDLDYKLSVTQFMPLLGFRTKRRDRPELDVSPSPYHDLARWHRIPFLYNYKTKKMLQDMRLTAAQPHLIDRFIKLVENESGHRLVGQAEDAKIELSESDVAKIDLAYLEANLIADINRIQFEESIREDRAKIEKAIQECLTQAGVKAEDISALFLTGGTTSIPSIRDACIQQAPNAAIIEGDKFGSVGIGLAIDAGIKFGPNPPVSSPIESPTLKENKPK